MSSHLVQPCWDNMQSKLLNRPAMTSSKPGRSDIEEALAKKPNTTTSSTTTTSYSVKNGNVGLAPPSHHANYSINLAFKMLTQHMSFACGTGLHIAAVVFMLTWCITCVVELSLDVLCHAFVQSEVLSDSLQH